MEGKVIEEKENNNISENDVVEATKKLRDAGAHRVYLSCVHPLFVKNALLKILLAGVEDIVFTDTIEQTPFTISVAPLIAHHLRSLL